MPDRPSSWKDRLTRFGFARKGVRSYHDRLRGRALLLEALEQRQLLSIDVRPLSFATSGNNLVVQYEVTDQNTPAFDIGVYTSTDQVSADTLLMTHRVADAADLTVGSHKVSFAADFTSPQSDHFLLAHVDDSGEISESQEANNNAVLQQGIFEAAHGSLIVHGSDKANDIYDLIDRTDGLEIWWGPRPQQVQLVPSCASIHVYTHGGNDRVSLTSVSSATTPLVAFGGDGADSLTGGAGDDVLDGGSGADVLAGGAGSNTLPGGPAIDVIDGVYDKIEVVDDGGPGYAETGSGWTTTTDGTPHRGTSRLHPAGDGSNVASWTFEGLRPDREYEVMAIYVPGADRASNARYTVFDGTQTETTVKVDQQATDRTAVPGQAWASLGRFTITSGTLVVELSDKAKGFVSADAVTVFQWPAPTDLQTLAGYVPDSSTVSLPTLSGGGMAMMVLGGGGAGVVGRHIFYNHSGFDGNDAAANALDDGAIPSESPYYDTECPFPTMDLGKTALLPGQTASFANLTSYSRGINGIMVDIADLPDGVTLDSGEDFEFRVGNDNDPSQWTAAPAPTEIAIRPGEGEGGSDRVTIVWSDNAIDQQWLQVTVLATADTGLPHPDVFYFGNQIGESDGLPGDVYAVNGGEIQAIFAWNLFGQSGVGIDVPVDYNRDNACNGMEMQVLLSTYPEFGQPSPGDSWLSGITTPSTVAIDRFYVDNGSLKLDYTIACDPTTPLTSLEFGLYASLDGETLYGDPLLSYAASGTGLETGFHTTDAISPAFADLDCDYYLLAVIEPGTEATVMQDEVLFEGGVFQTTDQTVLVCGTEAADVVTVTDSAAGGLGVELNGVGWGPVSSYGDVHVRTLGEADSITMVSAGAATPLVAFGGDGDDTITGGDGNDALHGGDGDDTLYGQQGDDIISGQDGTDALVGGIGADMLDGGEGDDLLEGGDGDDVLYGGDGIDTLEGENGADWLAGGPAIDVLRGGSDFDHPEVLDNADLTLSGNWTLDETEAAFNGTQHVLCSQSQDTAAWTFNNLAEDSVYGVFVTWSEHAGATTDAPFSVLDSPGGSSLGAVHDIDQSEPPTGYLVGDNLWQHLGVYEITASETLCVELTEAMVGDVLADAVRLVSYDVMPATNLEQATLSTEGTQLMVDYDVTGQQDATPFSIGIYSSVNGVTPGTLLMTYLVEDSGDLNVGGNSVTFDADFCARPPEGEEYLIAVLDVFDELSETNETSNYGQLDQTSGGIFISGEEVYVYGTENADQLEIAPSEDDLEISLGNLFETFPDGLSEVTEILVFLHDGGDTVTVDETVSAIDFVMSVYGGGGGDTILGASGDDVLHGQAGQDSIDGGAGSDTIYGGDDSDTLSGGDHDDFIFGNAGEDDIDGGTGNDTINGGDDNDTLSGGNDDDAIYGNAGEDSVSGDLGDDLVYGGDDNDNLSGGDGHDKIYGDEGLNTMDGGSGNDFLYGGDDGDLIAGGTGDDWIDGALGDDSITAGDGSDTVKGGPGEDTIDGGAGIDFLDGGLGNDSILGGAGNDVLDGGHQDDFLDGGGGNDWLEGGLGDDTLYGDGADTVGGNDIIYGGDDNDSIFGGPGHDDLYGGGGDDTINGEAGCDVLDGEDGEDTIDGGDDLDSPEIIDNNESGYSEENAAMWETWTEGIEYGEDYRVHFYNQSGSNPTTATWGFGGMQGLQADVYVTWEGGDWGIEDNTYRVSGNMTGTLDTQQPDGFGQEVHDWQWAQIDVSVAGQLSYDTLTVQLEVPNEEEQPEQAGCADAAMIMPIWPELNLCTDSNNDASIDPYLGDPDDLVEERLPGRLIALQGETRAEVQLRLKVNGYDLNGCHLELTFDESMVSVWTASSGGTQLSSGATWPCSNQDVVESVYVTGLQPGRSLLTLALLGFAPQRPVPDHVGISAFGVDLDIDSNNDGYIDPDNSLLGTDDPIEDIAGQDAAPGKIILVSDEDTDGDGLVDWADGFDYWPTVAADDSSSAARFVPVELQLQGGIDLADIAIAISYSDSDPLTMEDPFIPPQHGNLRIWKKDAFQPRNPQSALAHPAGDYVASGVYTAADLGLAVGTNRLYVEAISPSTTTADQTVLVRLCPTGNSSSSTYMEDQIRITTTRIEVSAESETVAAPFDAFEFIATGLPEGITDDHCGYGPDAFQTYTIKVYDPRLGFTECLVDGTSVPLTRIDTHYESFNSFVVLEPDDAELLLADAPLEMYLKPIGSYWYGASALPDDAEAYVNPIPWAVADDLPAERVSVSDDVLSVDSTGVDGQYFVELTDAEYWNLAQDTTVEIRFRLVADDPAGNDGAWTVIVGDDTEYWEIGVLADRLVTYPGGVRTETLLPASLLTGVFHAFHFEKLATDSNATISIDGSVVTIEEGQSGSNVGLRWGDPGAGVRGHVQYDYVQWEYDNSAASETLVYEVRPSDVVGSCDAITVQSAHPTVRYNPHTVKTKASFAQIRAAATLVKETIVEVEAELQNEQWTPAAGSDVFAYGNELHRRVANKLEEYEISGGGMFRAGVGVKFSDKTITRFNATNGNQHFLATDLVWFEHGYKPRVGDALDPSRCMAFEVKTSAGKNPFSAISLQQRGRYHRVFGRGRTWAAMSKYGLHGGVMEINARWNRRMKLFGLIGLASSAYAVLTLDDGRLHAMDDQLENDIKRLRRTRNNPEANFQARVELMETIVQYLDVCTGGQSNEIMGIARRAQFYRALGETFGTNE